MSKLIEWASVRQPTPDLIKAGKDSLDKAVAMTTEELKNLWDGDWPLNEVKDGIYLEHVHLELNKRGEGKYCAV